MPKPHAIKFFAQSRVRPTLKGQIEIPNDIGEPGVDREMYPDPPRVIKIGDGVYAFAGYCDNRIATYMEVDEFVEIDPATVTPV